MACLTASSGRFSPSRMPLLGSSPEPDVEITSRQCCASCTGFQSRDELTLSWRVSSSCPCLVGHLLTWPTTYIWLRKAPDVGSAHLLTDLVLFHEHATHSATGVFLSPVHVFGTACQHTYAMKRSHTTASGVN